MLPELTVKVSLISASAMLAIAEVVTELTESANKVGTLGMQGLLALMLIVLGFVTWYLERRRTGDREQRDKMVLEQYNTLLAHHEQFAKNAEVERSGFHLEMKAHAVELRGLTERSILAMHAMATSTDALREYLKDRHEYTTIEERRQLKEPPHL